MNGTPRRAILGAALAAAGARAAGAEQPPSPFAPPSSRPRPMTLLVGAAGGSAPDRWVRGFAPFLERHLRRVQISVGNRVSLGGLGVLRELADGPADGSVLGYVATPAVLARMVEANEVDLLGRLRLLGTVAEEPIVLVAAQGTDIAALRAERDRPLALPPVTSASAQAAVAAGDALPLAHLHFPSAAAARLATVAGNAAAAMLSLPDALPALREGKLGAIGVASGARSVLLPDVPTLTEAGLPLIASLQRGFLAPAGMPEGRVAAIMDALRKAVADPEFAAQTEAWGTTPRALTAREWGEVVATDLAALRYRWESSPWTATRG
ncbi:tripartite tricarboxylate transporter substrate-binding protein [Roseomonas sp. CCTCC AB2023176]|uniref:tripartite tricarboxylate transporter substrate-binding protein n=1 Tax=Roseomonas sp. CCTCC AB2023176 TaxID=3342640 RepID=UPI0035DA8578